jgi:phage head maturation protease
MERINFDRKSVEQVRFAVPLNLTVDPTRKVQGYAAVWDVIGSQPGEFPIFPLGSCVLPNYAVVLMYNHNSDWQLATEDNNSLTLSSDAHGLKIVGQLDQTFIEDFVVAKLGNGTIRGMSLGMYPVKSHKEQRLIGDADVTGNSELRPLLGQTITVTVYDRWLLDEVTITGKPVFPQTSVANFARAEDKAKELAAEWEREIDETLLRGSTLD